MSELNGANGRLLPKYEGAWNLSAKQVDVLATHHAELTAELIKWLDNEFRLRPSEDANWIMLGHHLIELLQISDASAFQGTCHNIIRTMCKHAPTDNPFVAASIAEARVIESDRFKKILEPFLEQNAFGLFPFATGFLNLGDPFSTLWSLRMLALAGDPHEYSEKVDIAIKALKQGLPDLMKSADFVGFFLYDLVMLKREQDSALIAQCAQRLIKEDIEWQKVDHNLRKGGFVAYDLMLASEVHTEGMHVAERWLEEAFSLSDDPKGPPKPFINAQRLEGKQLPTDVWAQGYLRALISAALYLRMRCPDYTPASNLIANSVITQNHRAELLQFCRSAHPYLPSIERMRMYRPQLNLFWDGDAGNFNKSVFVSRWMGGFNGHKAVAPISKAIADAVCEELNKMGLIGRYTGDRDTPYSERLWDNNEIYLRGCKFGIAVFEGMPGNEEALCGINHNVLVESGFMWGKGANVLVVRDPSKSPGLPTDLNGILHSSFDSEDPKLTQLRRAVRGWAKGIVKQKEEPEEGDPED